MTADERTASGLGLATRSLASGRTLAVHYPFVTLGSSVAGEEDALRALEGSDPIRKVERVVVRRTIDLDAKPIDAEDVYLRLHLLSHRLVKPHGQNMDGVFGLLNIVVWTNFGPCDPEGFELTRLGLAATGNPVTVFGVDKFPRMTDFVIPSGVRIAHADRVRLGAHLAEGTVVMHEGFVNFNAGTLGTAMVEGRISAGVIVGANSDIGGGASIMGTLSGGGKETVRVGERCLLGANSGIGISLGDDCIVEAGLYITAGTRVTLPDGEIVKAKELSGHANLLYIRDSVTGAVRVKERSGSWGGLNKSLHSAT
jgi:2,3,4,5-tetrahydropyridine-2,6-dicarboxylate N-succinyltransferase